MKLKVCAVYDSAIKAYMHPFMVRTLPEATRSFAELANNRQHQFGKFPSDYWLFHIGDYDEETGMYEQPSAFYRLGSALEFQDDAPPVPVNVSAADLKKMEGEDLDLNAFDGSD